MAYDMTELQAVDFALGAVIASAFTGLSEVGPANYVRFLQRPVVEKIYRTEHADAKELLDKITSDRIGSSSGADAQNRPDLPLVGYFRKPGLTNGDFIAVSGKRLRWSESLLNALHVATLPVTLDYSMTLAAWDKPALDKLCLAWYAKVAWLKRTRFIVPAKVGGEILDVPAALTTPKEILFSDASVLASEQRLYAVTIGLQIQTQVIVGEAIDPITEVEVWGITNEYISSGGYA